jgi:isopenicillin N synthase-like dioxygenase
VLFRDKKAGRMTAIPIIDVSGLSSDPAAASPAVKAIGAACRNVGFFYVTGHSVPKVFSDNHLGR